MFQTVAKTFQSSRWFIRNSRGMIAAWLLVGVMHMLVLAEEKPGEKLTEKPVEMPSEKSGEKSRAELLAVQRFELMQKRVTAAKITSKAEGFPTQVESRPLFKYSDSARGYVAAAVWKLGAEGRPRALLATELNPALFGRPRISYEYISLTDTPFTLKSDDMQWTPSKTLYQFRPIPDAPIPEKTAARRLIQIRDIGKRFAAHEEVFREKCELRLLPQPVDRYVPSMAERADGAIMLFTFGTNPEVVLLLESDGETWNYAAGRMTGAEVVIVTLDNKVAWEGAPLQKGSDSPFTGSISAIDIPGINRDGTESAP